MKQERLDKFMVDQALVQTRAQAQKLILAGAVKIKHLGQWVAVHKPALKISQDTQLQIDAIQELQYVSRAGLKLDGAIQHIIAQQLTSIKQQELFFNHQILLDIGQSTGGFTDCALKHQAQKIVGIDVGHGQLAESLKQHQDVICLEGINARHLECSQLLPYSPAGFDWILMDVSFISQTLIHPKLFELIKPSGYFLSLVKPQFELTPEKLCKGGIVKNVDFFAEVKAKIITSIIDQGLTLLDYFPSIIQGADGNQEYFVLAQKIQG
jgi:23S rRNA (cytidine1920-2'-O)/16S rRNA (cytidine1409-2'-O)-methyltransferase